ncbi:MAG: site-specific DNA-methyltransferase [Bacteroidetes bacterium]|nr:MAG: site-specific DNA-methyltransferase [Bacteroidota bacterium]
MSKAPRNKTLTLTAAEKQPLKRELLHINKKVELSDILNKTIQQDMFKALDYLPDAFVDLLFVDPPYNLSKKFNKTSFKEMESEAYELWLDQWLSKIPRLMKPNASIYICGDWKSSAAIYNVARKYFHIQNRITFEREKGRGAKSNWKNASEDIWFCTMSKDYYFDVEAVKMKRKVLAPYTDNKGKPKDWSRSKKGKYRLTFPSNLWTDISIPFWSMPENTEHPTQKPEKLVAKIILASSKEGDLVFDPFLGSGTTSVVAKKLNRKFVGIELDEDFACIAEKRLQIADENTRIQGYVDGVFWERNTEPFQNK